MDTYHLPESYSYVVSELPIQMYPEVGVWLSLGPCGDMTKSFVEIDYGGVEETQKSSFVKYVPNFA